MKLKKKEQRKEIGFIHNDFINKKTRDFKENCNLEKKMSFQFTLIQKKNYIYITQMPLVFPVIMKKY